MCRILCASPLYVDLSLGSTPNLSIFVLRSTAITWADGKQQANTSQMFDDIRQI